MSVHLPLDSITNIEDSVKNGQSIRVCIVCKSKRTSNRVGVVDKLTLARKVKYVCWDCDFRTTPIDYMSSVQKAFFEEQEALKKKRAMGEMEKITDNSGDSHVDGETFLEQFGAKSRKIIRSFLKSDFSEATVSGASISTIKEAINTLSLGDIVYAEQRDQSIVLRRL